MINIKKQEATSLLKNWILLLILLSLVSACSTNKKITSVSASNTTFTKDQVALISKGDSLTPMRVYKINSRQDSILLRANSEDIVFIDNDSYLETFAKRLLATVKDSASLGVGIAAPQVGVLKNMIWIQRFDKEEFPFGCYLNPKIITYSEEKIPCPEGCLSIPNKRATTQNRSKVIEIEYDLLDGSHHKESVEGFTSVIFQHEIDHLHGILFIDHLVEEINDAKSQ